MLSVNIYTKLSIKCVLFSLMPCVDYENDTNKDFNPHALPPQRRGRKHPKDKTPMADL